MTFKLTIKIPKVEKLFNQLDKGGKSPETREILNKIGEKATFYIVTRTGRGRDVNKKLFKSYSDKYRIFRKDKAQRPVNRVDLTFKGKMLSSINHEIIKKNTVKLFFDDSKASSKSGIQGAKAKGHHFGSKKLPQRKFFSLNDGELDLIAKEVEIFVENELKKAG